MSANRRTETQVKQYIRQFHSVLLADIKNMHQYDTATVSLTIIDQARRLAAYGNSHKTAQQQTVLPYWKDTHTLHYSGRRSSLRRYQSL